MGCGSYIQVSEHLQNLRFCVSFGFQLCWTGLKQMLHVECALFRVFILYIMTL